MPLVRIDCGLVGSSPLQQSVQLAGQAVDAAGAGEQAAADLALALAWAMRRLV